MNAGRQTGEGESFARAMTVARVREHAGSDWADVAFLESAQVYRLSKRHPRFDAMLATLRAAAAASERVNVRFAAPSSDLIEDVG